MVAGKEVSPKDVQNTDRLKKFWDEGGNGRIHWGAPGDFNQCVDAVTKAAKGKMTPDQAKGYCAERHHDATGAWPGHAPGEQVGKHNGKGK